MTGGWDDYAAALRFRNLIEDIATKQAEKVLPADFTAQVVSIDVPNLVASVKQAGDAGLLIAKFSPSLQPRTVGCFVRISGYPGNYYISAILDEAAINQVYETTTQQALDAANQALGAVSTDGLVPTQAPVVTMAPLGYAGVVLKWDAITNADPVKYRVLFDKVSPPIGVLTETTGLIVSTSQTPTGELLDSTQTYYAQVIPFDADGDGPASAIVSGGPVVVPANAVSEDIIVANTIFSRTGYFGTISVNQLETGSLTATIDVTTGRINIGTISIDQTSGIRIPLPDNGQIVFPNDGTAAIFEKVGIHAAWATFDGNVDIQGQDNKLSGRLLLVGTVPPPSLAPQAVSANDPAPLAFTIPAAYAGIGDTGTYWQSAAITSYDGNTGILNYGVFSFNKSDGTRPASYAVSIDFYNVGTSYTVFNGYGREGEANYTDYSYGPAPQPVILSFHSTAGYTVTSFYVPAYTYQYRYRNTAGAGGYPAAYTSPWYTATAQAARYQIIVTNNSTHAVVSNFVWSSDMGWSYPAVFTDDTYVYAAATYSDGSLRLWRYGMDGTGGAQQFNSGPGTYGPVNLTGLWIGQGDYGVGQTRCIVSWTGAIGVFTMGGVRNTSEEWTSPEYCRGLIYSSGKFYMHGGSSKIWKASSLLASASRSVKYTWYDAVGTVHESTPSPVAAVTQQARKFLQVVTQPAPNGGAPDDPSTVRIYIDSHLQADVPSGITSVYYDIPSTSGGDSPTIDGFASIGGHGAFESSLHSPARVQQITITGTPTGGSFQLTYGTNTTAAIAFNATAATVQTTINNLLATLGAGTVTVGGGPGPGTPWVVSFSSTTPLQLGAVNNLTGGVSPAIDITGGPPVTQFQGDGTWHISTMAGVIMPYAGAAAPDGFLMCDGQAVSRVTYADLYRVIGTQYGAGDGSTTFNVPNLQGRTVVGMHHGVGGAADAEFDTLGEVGGSKYLQAHAHAGPSHNHGLSLQYSTTTATGGSAYRVTDINGSTGGGGTGTTAVTQAAGTGATTTVGSGNSQNLQPYIALNYIIKV